MKYFKPEEFACKCGCGAGYEDMDESLLRRLDKSRELAGIPFNLTSAVRCEDHNASVGGKPDSAHIGGFAVDISAVDSRARFKIVKALMDAGFTRIGINFQKGFIHVDSDPTKPHEVLFSY
jgi:uncharacterized protein YcbK (DUF882 family)